MMPQLILLLRFIALDQATSPSTRRFELAFLTWRITLHGTRIQTRASDDLYIIRKTLSLG